MQGMIYHHILGKRIPALEELRKGMELYGIRDLIENNKDKFRKYFCCEELSSSAVIASLNFVNKEDEPHTHSLLVNFLKASNQQYLKKFLLFTTDNKMLPFGKSIKVEYLKKEGFYASTCTLKLDIPTTNQSQSEFNNSLKTVLENNCKSFSVV